MQNPKSSNFNQHPNEVYFLSVAQAALFFGFDKATEDLSDFKQGPMTTCPSMTPRHNHPPWNY